MQMLIPYGYTLRKACEEDIDGVINVNSVALPEHYTHSFYASIFSTNPDTFLVIEYNGRVVAYHMGRIEYGFSFKTKPQIVKKGHIISIAVLEEHRRKGLATALVQKAIEEFKKHKCEMSFLEVRVSNEPAINMYKKLGYHVVQRIRGYYNDGEDAYVMEIDLKDKTKDEHNN